MPLVTRSGVSWPSLMYLAPFAVNSNMVIWLIAILCSLAMSISNASLCISLIETPIVGRKYVVSSKSFKFQPSLRVLFCVCGILQKLSLRKVFRGTLPQGLGLVQLLVFLTRFCK